MKQEKKFIVYKKIDDLIPYINNTRTHTDEQINQVAGSIKEFGQVLVASWRIILASIVAMFISEVVDSQIYQWYADKFKKYQFMRVLTSNFVSVPLDSIIVTLIAFYGVMPASVLVSITIVNIAIKYTITLMTVPSIYLVKEKLKN